MRFFLSLALKSVEKKSVQNRHIKATAQIMSCSISSAASAKKEECLAMLYIKIHKTRANAATGGHTRPAHNTSSSPGAECVGSHDSFRVHVHHEPNFQRLGNTKTSQEHHVTAIYQPRQQHIDAIESEASYQPARLPCPRGRLRQHALSATVRCETRSAARGRTGTPGRLVG